MARIPFTDIQWQAPMWVRSVGLKIDKTVGQRSILYRKMPEVPGTELFATEMEELRDQVKEEAKHTARALTAFEQAVNMQSEIDSQWATVPAVLASAKTVRSTAALAAQKAILTAEKQQAQLDAGFEDVRKVRQLRQSGKFKAALKSASVMEDA